MIAEVTGFKGSKFSVCSSWSFCASDVVIGTKTSRICAVVMVIESVLTSVVIEILFFMKDGRERMNQGVNAKLNSYTLLMAT